MSANEVYRRLRPVCREQIARMSDEPLVWSGTHDWPGIRDELELAGLISRVPELSAAEAWTQLTDLGREVRTVAQRQPRRCAPDGWLSHPVLQ